MLACIWESQGWVHVAEASVLLSLLATWMQLTAGQRQMLGLGRRVVLA